MSHKDLASFLAYATRTGLNPASTVFVGTHYEYTVQASLRRYGFQLERTGGRSDLGIDLIGSWRIPLLTSTPPSLSPPEIKILVQCKSGVQKIQPSMMRELAGAFVGAPSGWRGSGVLAFLVTEQAATRGTLDSLRRGQWPMGIVRCSRDGRVSQLVWNHMAQEAGLTGVEVGVARDGNEDGLRARLLHNGRPIPLLNEE